MPNLKPMEIVLILLVVLLLFGARRLPELALGIGRSLKIFKHEVRDMRDDDHPAQTSPRSVDEPHGLQAPTTTAKAPTRPPAPVPDPADV